MSARQELHGRVEWLWLIEVYVLSDHKWVVMATPKHAELAEVHIVNALRAKLAVRVHAPTGYGKALV